MKCVTSAVPTKQTLTINGGDIPDIYIDNSYCPRIVKLAYAIGDVVITKDIETDIVKSSYRRRDKILKNNLSPVATNLFLESENTHISAILYSQ